jgi:hypothetical protein
VRASPHQQTIIFSSREKEIGLGCHQLFDVRKQETGDFFYDYDFHVLLNPTLFHQALLKL